MYGEAHILCGIENYKQVYVELERFVFSRTSRLTNVPTVYRVPMPIDPKNVLRKQGRHPDTPTVLLKMEKAQRKRIYGAYCMEKHRDYVV